jgi:hypothetical protein
VKRSNTTDCKSVGLCLRRFESSTLHQILRNYMPTQPPIQKWESKRARLVYWLVVNNGGMRSTSGLVGLIAYTLCQNFSSKQVSIIIFFVAASTYTLILRIFAIHYGYDTRTLPQRLQQYMIDTVVLILFLLVLLKFHAFDSILSVFN